MFLTSCNWLRDNIKNQDDEYLAKIQTIWTQKKDLFLEAWNLEDQKVFTNFEITQNSDSSQGKWDAFLNETKEEFSALHQKTTDLYGIFLDPDFNPLSDEEQDPKTLEHILASFEEVETAIENIKKLEIQPKGGFYTKINNISEGTSKTVPRIFIFKEKKARHLDTLERELNKIQSAKIHLIASYNFELTLETASRGGRYSSWENFLHDKDYDAFWTYRDKDFMTFDYALININSDNMKATIAPFSNLLKTDIQKKNNANFSDDGKTLVKYNGIINNFSNLEGVESIGRFAFSNSTIKTIVLPASIKSLALGAFAFSSMSDLQLQDNITVISEAAFLGASFKDILLSENV